MFVLREVFADDLAGLHAVAGHLDTVNLPDDRAIIEHLIHDSSEAFAGKVDAFKREYMLVLEDVENKRVIGTSMIHAQHGTRRAPHIFFDVITDERYSETLDKHMVHRVIRIGYNYNGPTEIGGLVLMPEYRGHDLALGKWLSYVRFLYIGLHRDRFRDQVLSELLPPLENDGTSLLWEALGRNFTGMSYQEADRISKTNKEFIRALFPADPIYLTLLPEKVQQLVGQVGPETKGVEKMLRRIGFEYVNRIDPFDGGPHFLAATDDITLVQNSRRMRVGRVGVVDGGRPFGLVSVERDRVPHFAATGTHYIVDGDTISLPEAVARALGIERGDEVGLLPL